MYLLYRTPKIQVILKIKRYLYSKLLILNSSLFHHVIEGQLIFNLIIIILNTEYFNIQRSATRSKYIHTHRDGNTFAICALQFLAMYITLCILLHCGNQFRSEINLVMRKLLIVASLFHPINIKWNKFRGNSLQQGPILYPWCSIFRPFILNVRYVKSSHIESPFYFRFAESDAIDASLSISSTFCRGLLGHSIESLYPSSKRLQISSLSSFENDFWICVL